ncbi:hypothetical protein LTR48_005418 [Friedmanniomyces endolithicus]|uniref:N-acetyltransferase domain-containing protein n=1 Tax=Rachicladosporium monterosium TaxID=1507873 RepID=A0ABR0L2A6_9PEZI|nr:hypothetical protein LTR48_005418 [Friedmanniomyces endolithicus]KAK5142379.1 hypothetical protein LTR32_005258 [Rachicladosporium monterosium]
MTSNIAEVTISNTVDSSGNPTSLSASKLLHNKHVKGTVGVHFDEIETDDCFPWHSSVHAEITYQAAGTLTECLTIGLIDFDIVDTTVPACEGEETWMEYLLDFSADYDDPLRPIGAALEFVLDMTGGVCEGARKFGAALGSRTIVYVCEIELLEEWRKKDPGSAAVEVLHHMLPAHLGHGDAAMVLQPAVLDRGVSKEMEGEYQKMPFRFYGGLGYEKWFATKNGAKAPHTLMGRKL